jgi:hypothetical protein
VVATVPFDLIFGFLVGLVFAGCARAQFSGGAMPWGRELVAVLLYEGIIVWPVALYFYFVFPDWSWMYFVDAQRLPRTVSLLVLLGYLVALMAGYFIGWALLRAHKGRYLAGFAAGVAVGLAAFSLALRARLFSVGTFAEFHAGHAASAWEGKLLWSLGVTGAGLCTAIVLVGFALWEQGKRYRTQ